jgi:threonyl-tRNA synthetase
LLGVGDKEVEQLELAVRTRTGEDLGNFKEDDFIAKLSEEVKTRK